VHFTTYADIEADRDGARRRGVELTINQTGALSPLTTALVGRLTRRYVEMEAQGLKRWCEASRTD
jgi:hypothetical protein